MMGSKPKIGAFVLETLTTGMYTEPLDTIRELIQNSMDGIQKAQHEGILKSNGHIQVLIIPDRKSLIIRDNGTGISSEKVKSRLLNVGMSDKDINEDAGFRGIGRLAAIAYCSKLHFRTSFSGELTQSNIIFDSDLIRRNIQPSSRNSRELTDIIIEGTEIVQEDCDKSRHFFEVELQDILTEQDSFLDWQILEEYLRQVAPVEFDPQEFIFARKIYDWTKENNITLPSISCSIDIESISFSREILKPYSGYTRTKGQRSGQYTVEIKDIECLPVEVNGNMEAWLWYAKTDLLGTIKDDRIAGLRLRKNNISLGNSERVSDIFEEVSSDNRRFNNWLIGEIHILNPRVIPNARRDGVESNSEWSMIKNELKKFIKERCAEIRQTSSARNTPTVKLQKNLENDLSEINTAIEDGVATKKEKEQLLSKISKDIEKTEKWIETNKDQKKEIKSITELNSELIKKKVAFEKSDNFALKKIKSSLSRKERKILIDILEVIEESLKSMDIPNREIFYKKLKKAILAKYGMNNNG